MFWIVIARKWGDTKECEGLRRRVFFQRGRRREEKAVRQDKSKETVGSVNTMASGRREESALGCVE